MAKLTMRTPERKPQRAQSPDISLGSFNAAVDDPGGGWTMVDQHEAPIAWSRARQAAAQIGCANREKHNGTHKLLRRLFNTVIVCVFHKISLF